MSIITIQNVSEWNEIIKNAGNTILVIKFEADFCMPCKASTVGHFSYFFLYFIINQ